MGHGQCLVYSSKSSIFEECIVVFRFWYIGRYYRFLKSVFSFSKPQLKFRKLKMSRILLSISLNCGSSSYGISVDNSRGTPISSIFMGFYIINHPAMEVPPIMETLIWDNNG